MSDSIEVRVPDIGDFKDVPVIEVLVKPGDTIKRETPLVTLESDKASMEVPSTADGIVEAIKVKVGDKVSQGTVLLTIKGSKGEGKGAVVIPSAVEGQAKSSLTELKVPDLGDFKDVPVIEVLVKPGDVVKKDAPLVTLESDKASMEVPASAGGTIASVVVKIGDKVSTGTVIATANSDVIPSVAKAESREAPPTSSSTIDRSPSTTPEQSSGYARDDKGSDRTLVHASPTIRRFARELGVDLHGVRGSGPNGRVTREDVQGFVKGALRNPSTGLGAGSTAAFAGLPAWPKVDFAQFGPIERTPLPRIKKISGPNLHRNWLQIPHITNYDEADVTELEAFRNEINAEQTTSGPSTGSGQVKLTMLAFLIKACVNALQRFPDFNSSLDGDELVRKKYYNIGFAADTPNGLVVPVLKGADGKGLVEIARETAGLAARARDGKLGLADMQGSTFTISSIGGIGGTAFTQIVNAPEVAILGATRSSMKPVWDGKAFVPRLLLPVSVSYDHRVIDGAGAARFLVHVAALLRDFRRVLL